MHARYEQAGSETAFDGRGVARDAVGRPVRPRVSVTAPLRPDRVDLDRSPVLVLWETTRARHGCERCAVEARHRRDPDELSTVDALRLMNDVRGFGPVSFVLTGGDPMRRPDLYQLVAHGARIGLRVGLALPCNAEVGAQGLRALRRAGLGRVSVRLHGAPLLGIGPGDDNNAVRTLLLARDVGLATQAETVLDSNTADMLESVADALLRLGVGRWSVHVPADADAVAGLGAVATEKALRALRELDDRLPLEVRVAGAPQARRVALQKDGTPPSAAGGRAVRDGRGLLFVAYDGSIRPSRNLPVAGGRARTDDVVDIYCSAEIFQALRDPARLKGKCGACSYRDVCGGNRARALAVTGDMLEEDPLCPYVPSESRTTDI